MVFCGVETLMLSGLAEGEVTRPLAPVAAPAYRDGNQRISLAVERHGLAPRYDRDGIGLRAQRKPLVGIEGRFRHADTL